VAPVTVTHDGGYVQQTLVTHFVDTSTAPLAVCNDGTPALYVVRPGYGGGAKRWLISLEGGGSCIDATTCQQRRDATSSDVGYILTTSSKGIQPTGNHGILASDPAANPDFYDANEVRVHYCSSDSWQGTHAGQGSFSASDPSTWSFQGHAIVKAVVNELLANGMADADEVVLEGESAGGGGVFFNANAVAALLPAQVRFVAVSDAAIVVNVPGYDPSASGSVSTAPPPYPNDVKQTTAGALWQATGDEACSQTHDAGDLDCSDPVYLLDNRFYPMPVFVRQSEEDMQKMPDLGAPDPLSDAGATPAAQAYFTYYEGQQRATMNALPAPYSAFAPNITDHIDLLGGDANGPFTFDTPVFTFPDGEMLSTEQALHTWYAAPCTQHLWVQ
jgi:hypothetical protein